jgi:deazaflavin-dependent oxidoreductase (nitroreductase family)
MDEPQWAVSTALPPTRTVALVRRVATPIWRQVGITSEVAVQGRRTGAPVKATIVPAKIDGTLYLVSFGGTSDWVCNLRTAWRGELRTKGRAASFTATEITGPERDRVIATYRGRLPGPFRRDFDRRPGAGDHPVFRVEWGGSA